MLGFNGIKVYRLLWIAAVAVSAAINSELIWSIADTINVLIVLPNVTTLFILRKET